MQFDFKEISNRHIYKFIIIKVFLLVYNPQRKSIWNRNQSETNKMLYFDAFTQWPGTLCPE